MQNPRGWWLKGRLPLSGDPHGGPSAAPKGGPVPGSCSSDRESLGLGAEPRPAWRAGRGRPAAEGWGKARVQEKRPPFKGETRPGGRWTEPIFSWGSPGKGDWRAKVVGTAAALGAPAGPPLFPPGATRPGLVSTPGYLSAPHPSTETPASRIRLGSPARASTLRTHARPHCAPSPRPQPGVVQPAALGSFQRRAPGESSPAPSPAAAKPPTPPAQPSSRPRPVQPSWALFGRSWPGAATGRAAGCSGASSEHNGRAGQASPAQSRRAAHSVASESPLECLQFEGNSGICSLLTWRLAGLGFPGSAPLHILAVAWDPSGARAPAPRGVRAPAGLPGGRREDTHCGSLSLLARSRAPPAGDVIPSASAEATSRGAGPRRGQTARVTTQPRGCHALRPMRRRGAVTWHAGF